MHGAYNDAKRVSYHILLYSAIFCQGRAIRGRGRTRYANTGNSPNITPNLSTQGESREIGLEVDGV